MTDAKPDTSEAAVRRAAATMAALLRALLAERDAALAEIERVWERANRWEARAQAAVALLPDETRMDDLQRAHDEFVALKAERGALRAQLAEAREALRRCPDCGSVDGPCKDPRCSYAPSKTVALRDSGHE